MTIRRHGATVVALLVSATALRAQEAKVTGDLARLQGKWAALTILPDGTKIKKGNVVDVVLNPARKRKGALPTIREIHLVEGTLKDAPRHLDDAPGNAR
jgi:hypothetical protein